MSANKFKHYDLNQAKRKNLTIASFGGVDYSSQKFNVAKHRAIDIKNFIYKNGVIQKRHGYEQVAQLNLGNFNGIWRFLAEDGEYHIIAHIGKKLYTVSEDFRKFTQLSATEFEDYRSSAFVGSNRLWFLGGNKYMVIRFTASTPNGSVEEVEDNDNTFVPTTTIAIAYANAKTESSRASLDPANAMTMFRHNKLLSGVGKNENSYVETEFFEYTLDGPILTKTKIEEGDTYGSLSSKQEILKKFKDITIKVEDRGTI